MHDLIRSPFTFREVFENLHLAIFSPKKDQCDLCCAKNREMLVKMSTIFTFKGKSKDKDESDENTAVFTKNVQAVLLCPLLKVSAICCKEKLRVYNLTLYNIKSQSQYLLPLG